MPGNAEPGIAVVDARQRLARHDRRRRWRIAGDIAVGVLLYVVGLVIVMIASTGMHGAFGADGQLSGVGVLLVLLGWVLWLTVFVRSRWPWVPLAAGLVLALLGGDVLLLLIGVFHAVVRLPRRQAVGAAVTGAVVVAAALVRTAVRAPQYNPFAIFVLPPDAVLHDGMHYDISSDTAIVLRVLVLTLGIAAIGIAAGVGYLVRRTRRMRTVETFAAHQTERSEALTEQLARQSEREMLARELHDTLAHRLSVISLHSGALMVSAGDPERTVQTATALQREAKASLEEVRSIVRDVRGEDRSQVGAAGTAAAPALATLRTVPDLVASFRATGAPVSATLLLEDLDSAPAVLQKAVYRIIQESLSNAIKHAHGADVTVDVRASAIEGVHVVVSNPLDRRVRVRDQGAADGVAADGMDAYLAGSGGGMGLIGIQERARLVGGDAEAGPREGRFVVEVTLPPWGGPARE